MEQRVTTYSQYAISSIVSGVKNMEAQTLNGISVQKIYFQPNVNLDLAISQTAATSGLVRRFRRLTGSISSLGNNVRPSAKRWESLLNSSPAVKLLPAAQSTPHLARGSRSNAEHRFGQLVKHYSAEAVELFRSVDFDHENCAFTAADYAAIAGITNFRFLLQLH
jgi:hypothetical protein